MNITHVVALRLFNQHLTSQRTKDVTSLVTSFGAVQAQDYSAAKWALGLRLKNAVDNDIEEAFASGAILRTHVMRPTWHFVAPADIRWLQQLTAPRVLTILRSAGKKLELDEPLYKRSNKLITKALQGGAYLTRAEVETILNKAGIITSDIRMVHFMMRAELDGIVCSGPRRGKQFTYALIDERAPGTKSLTKDEALAELSKRFFTSHGPATVQDFVWWSGLTLADARAGLDSVSSKLEKETIDKMEYWWSPAAGFKKHGSPTAWLLPNYDEYSVAYKGRSLLFDMTKATTMPPRDFIFTNVIIIDGRVAGTWKRTFKKDQVIISAEYYRSLSKAEKEAVAHAADNYGKFMASKVIYK